ncbi:ligase-associated DNA damage response endonuclease PdeM [Rhizosphaericola mali]|uniref:Ligase-associated DNA damage response endonuclease PdeM n=1 Tax=Rhizosphaericola mali TaxID=2545455 RepID=A0A5P2G0E3_9BACT|nr:ligase-associated DNA damage response endonuclease PdeM [Rhizosphaericola mali]QES88118.1 ligase-associated DNA damage response endonuclease PdeM [Rhizosphaericola mali]
MILKELEIEFGNERLILNNQRALYWPAENALIIADLHLGKAAHFRKNGIAIPTQISQTDLYILNKLIVHYQPEKLIIVGDFVHAQTNTEIEDFIKFKANHSTTQFILIKGNHDRLSDTYLHSLGIDFITNELKMNQISFIHELQQEQYQNTVSGHIHPGVQFTLGKTKKSLPCFVVDDYSLILPAFSQFTGLDTRNYYSNNVVFYPFNLKEILEFKF